MRKLFYLFFVLIFAISACDSDSDNTIDDTEQPDNGGDGDNNGGNESEDHANFLDPELDSEGKIIVRYTPKEYVQKVDEGQHMKTVLMPKDYYSSAVSLSGSALKSEIKDIITTGAKALSYSDVYNICEDADENPANTAHVYRIYLESGIDKDNRVSSVSYGWNREHVWSKSNGGFGTSNGPGTDIHHIRASDAKENGNRGNLKFSDVSGARTRNGSNYEPPLSAKGDVARMCFYMAVRYGYSIDRNADLEDLLKWNELDPVDPYEVRRNNIVYDHQNNRNPFVDHPELVQYIFGDRKSDKWKN